MTIRQIKMVVFSLSLLFVTICFGVSIWLSVVLGDMLSYSMAGLFGIAAVWFAVNVKNIYNEKQ